MPLLPQPLKPVFTALRRAVRKAPVARYAHARWLWMRDGQAGRSLFADPEAFFGALHRKGEGTLLLETPDGLKILIRQNVLDARIVREIFLEKPYIKHVRLPPEPTVIDVGGYIGDFSLYAVKHLGAKRVFVFEPTRENFDILSQNVAINGYGDRITAVNKAVSNSHELVLNVEKLAGQEMHVSAYWYREAERRTLPATTIPDIFNEYGLDRVHLLKVDCEGGEYDLFEAVTPEYFARIDNIVFEYHAIDGYRPRLDRLLGTLTRAGYRLRTDGDIVSAIRSTP